MQEALNELDELNSLNVQERDDRLIIFSLRIMVLSETIKKAIVEMIRHKSPESLKGTDLENL